MKHLCVLCVGLLASCSNSTNGADDKCSDNADCSAGQVCSSTGDCQVICNSDTQCASGEICDSDVCVVGSRSNAPEISAIRGNGSTACVSGPAGVECIADGLIVEGTNLGGSEVGFVRPGGATETLELDSTADTRIEAKLPVDVVANETYTLTVTNAAGFDQGTLQLLQGEPGPALTADELVLLMNTADEELQFHLLPTGATAGTVAVGDHSHPPRSAASDPGDCSADTTGATYFNTGDGRWYVCSGSAYVAVQLAVARDGTSAATAGHSCRDILLTGHSAGDGVYWIDPALRGGQAFQAFCDMTTDGGGWTMVYKLTSAVAGDPLALWRGQPVNEADGTMLNVDASAAHYVNRIVSQFWNRSGFTIGEARVSFYENGVQQAQFFQFDATGATREGWFSYARLANSGYSSPPTASTNFFSIVGDEEIGRRWFINQSYGGCDVDHGWMVIDVGSDTCTWEAPAGDTVKILFSTVAGSATWDSASASEPDVMAVLVR